MKKYIAVLAWYEVPEASGFLGEEEKEIFANSPEEAEAEAQKLAEQIEEEHREDFPDLWVTPEDIYEVEE